MNKFYSLTYRRQNKIFETKKIKFQKFMRRNSMDQNFFSLKSKKIFFADFFEQNSKILFQNI